MGKRATGATPLIGEMQVLRVVAPRHPAGEPFDVVAEMASRHDVAGGRAVMREVFPVFARTLADKGLLREEPGGLFSHTEAAEAFWRSWAGEGWKKARQGAGVAWKKGGMP